MFRWHSPRLIVWLRRPWFWTALGFCRSIAWSLFLRAIVLTISLLSRGLVSLSKPIRWSGVSVGWGVSSGRILPGWIISFPRRAPSTTIWRGLRWIPSTTLLLVTIKWCFIPISVLVGWWPRRRRTISIWSSIVLASILTVTIVTLAVPRISVGWSIWSLWRSWSYHIGHVADFSFQIRDSLFLLGCEESLLERNFISIYSLFIRDEHFHFSACILYGRWGWN